MKLASVLIMANGSEWFGSVSVDDFQISTKNYPTKEGAIMGSLNKAKEIGATSVLFPHIPEQL